MMKVCIVAKGRGWEHAPYNGCEVWGITQTLLNRPCDLVIDMNVYEDGRWGEKERQEAAAVKHICELNNIPYIDLHSYPIDEIVNFYGTDYFSNTVDYAIALAIYRGYDEIDLYGVTMEIDSEYYYQKPGVEFWTGMAKGKGIDVRVFGEYSSIMRTLDKLMYGYDIKQKFKEKEGVVFV